MHQDRALSSTMAAVALAAVTSAQPLTYDKLLVEQSPMQVRASGATYEGIVHDSMTDEILERARTAEDWYEARAGNAVFFAADRTSATSEEGLGEYRPGAATWRRYPMCTLALAAAWFTPRPDEYCPEFVRGVAVGGGRVWVGSAGLGVIARNLRDRTWSRYDVKRGILPGIHIFVLHADDEYVFVKSGGPSGEWRERLPDVRERDLGPALEVHSLRRNAWLRVRAIPRANVRTFGWTDANVSIPCDTRPLAENLIVAMEFCTWPDRAMPAEDGYLFMAGFAEPGEPMRFVITKAQLEVAFDPFR